MTAAGQSQPYPPPLDGAPRHRAGLRIDAGRLWAGGVATALVAALIAIAGIMIARGVFDIAVLAPSRDGTWGSASTPTYAACAFLFGLAACALMHLLLVSTPSPYMFFGWLMALCALIGMAAPFAWGGDTAAHVATALINAAICIAVASLIVSIAHRSTARA